MSDERCKHCGCDIVWRSGGWVHRHGGQPICRVTTVAEPVEPPFVGTLDEAIAYLTEPLPDDLCAASWCGKPRSHRVHMTAEALASGIHPSGTHRFTEADRPI